MSDIAQIGYFTLGILSMLGMTFWISLARDAWRAVKSKDKVLGFFLVLACLSVSLDALNTSLSFFITGLEKQ